MDPLWRALEQHVSANRQYASMDEHVDTAVLGLLSLTRTETLRKADVLAKGFWLRD